MSERDFLIFSIYLQFFSEFSFPSRAWTEFGSKFFFFHFLGLSYPVLAKNNVEKRFLNFFNIFAIFFRNFLASVEHERNSEVKFFFLFLGLSHPVLAKNNVGKRFFNFFNFFTIFFGIFLPESSLNGIRSKFFFSLSSPISSCFG